MKFETKLINNSSQRLNCFVKNNDMDTIIVFERRTFNLRSDLKDQFSPFVWVKWTEDKDRKLQVRYKLRGQEFFDQLYGELQKPEEVIIRVLTMNMTDTVESIITTTYTQPRKLFLNRGIPFWTTVPIIHSWAEYKAVQDTLQPRDRITELGEEYTEYYPVFEGVPEERRSKKELEEIRKQRDVLQKQKERERLSRLVKDLEGKEL